jgi:hypothetical protein
MLVPLLRSCANTFPAQGVNVKEWTWDQSGLHVINRQWNVPWGTTTGAWENKISLKNSASPQFLWTLQEIVWQFECVLRDNTFDVYRQSNQEKMGDISISFNSLLGSRRFWRRALFRGRATPQWELSKDHDIIGKKKALSRLLLASTVNPWPLHSSRQLKAMRRMSLVSWSCTSANKSRTRNETSGLLWYTIL